MSDSKYLYEMDHYDAYNYIMIGPISFIASFLFIMINVYFKEARRFPGNLLIIISLAEMVLCIHWFISGLNTKYILRTKTIDENSFFCRLNSHVAVVSAAIEYWFQLAFLISIIMMFRNTMKEIKFKAGFVIIPSIIVILSWYFIYTSGGLGKNIYGTCSVNNLNKPGTLFLIANGFYLAIVIVTLWSLRRFQKQSRNEITIKDDFYKFYTNYTILIFILYSIIGLNFAVSKYINDRAQGIDPNSEEYEILLKWFFISRIANNVKIFIPFMTFLLRIGDPFIKKLMFRFLNEKKDKEPENSLLDLIPSENSVIMFDDDFAINSQIKTIRMRMVKTMLKGLTDYFGVLRHTYDRIEDETLLNQLNHEILPIGSDVILSDLLESESKVNYQRKSSSQDIKGLYECALASLSSKKFKKILSLIDNECLHESFDINYNKSAIKKSGNSDGGAGGEFFLITHDKKYIVKTITQEEMKVFQDFIESYCDYFQTNNKSFICKIIGMFEFNFKLTPQPTRVIVMQNLFGRRPSFIHRRYDLKGSTFARCVMHNTKIENKHFKISKTLKDIDFLNIEEKMNVTPEVKEYILRQLSKDVEFFRNGKVIDYSLLLGIVDMEFVGPEDTEVMLELEKDRILFYSSDRREAYIIGIIDYFQKYNFSKLFEKYYKKCLNCNPRLDTSSQSTSVYAKRFMDFMNRIILDK